MSHLSEEQLMLHYYREGDESRHLDSCPACRNEFAALQAALDAADDLPVPERGAGYGGEVWRRIAPRIAARPRTRVIQFPRWAAIAAVAAMLLLAFYAGRFSRGPQPAPATAIPAEVRERILRVTVGDHLERSQRVLAEVVNSEDPVEPERVEGLLSENRLYRQAARREGNVPVTILLEELERVLLEVAHAVPDDRGRVRRLIESEGILFKVRVAGSTLRDKEKIWKVKSWL
ncbi:MAG: hypothetical protein HYR60_20820 [Acidobacteria bacterium]|nr:hypothetical protein [Acidobacteriota bacterium]MBI3470302.1 hypothetical protein [Candidatus Solibacter usitatus]